IIELSKIKNIVSVKDATENFNQISEIIEKTDDSFTVYCGEDALTLPMMAVGANGVVSVASHIVGKKMQSMMNALETGELKDAVNIHQKLLPIMNILYKEPSPTPIKAALKMKAIDVRGFRLPLFELTKQDKFDLKKLVDEL